MLLFCGCRFSHVCCRIKSVEQPWLWVAAVLELKSKMTPQSSADKRESWDPYLAAALGFAAAVRHRRQSKTLARLFEATCEARGVFSGRGLTSFMSSLSPPLNQLLLESLWTGSAAFAKNELHDYTCPAWRPLGRLSHTEPHEQTSPRKTLDKTDVLWIQREVGVGKKKRLTNDGGETCPQPQVALTLN